MVCHFGANEVARVSFTKAGGPKEALSSLIFLELVQSARAFEFAASVVMNNQDVHSFCATVGDSFWLVKKLLSDLFGGNAFSKVRLYLYVYQL